jgi:hypothetical protein
MSAIGSSLIINALRLLISHVPQCGHVSLSGKIGEPESVSKVPEVQHLPETKLIGKVVGVASCAVVEDGVEGIRARIAYGSIHRLIALAALAEPAALECRIGIAGTADHIQGRFSRARRVSCASRDRQRITSGLHVACDIDA